MLALALLLLAQDTLPHWTLAPGETLRYRVTREQGLVVSGEGLSRSGRLTLTETFAVSIVRRDGAGTLALVKLEGCQGQLANDGKIEERYDSKATDAEPDFFADWADDIGTERRLLLADDGTCTCTRLDAPDASDEEGEAEDAVGWSLVFPRALHVTAAAPPRAQQDYPPLFAVDHGLFPWPMLADIELRPQPGGLFKGLECASFALEARFRLDESVPDFKGAVEDKKVAFEPSAGQGRLLFKDGALARLELDGETKLEFPDDDGSFGHGGAVMRITNRLTVELAERKPPR